MTQAYWQGLGLSAGLIIAIGAQNAHVLRMGLARRHVALTVAVCALCDALLIAAGVAGAGRAIEAQPWLTTLARYSGAAFLLWYGLRALRSARRPQALAADGAATLPERAPQALATVLALSLLNPHVYLDTVVLLGSIGSQQPEGARLLFGLGAVTASLFWFTALGFGARGLAPLFARPAAWRALDTGVGVTMLALATALLVGR